MSARGTYLRKLPASPYAGRDANDEAVEQIAVVRGLTKNLRAIVSKFARTGRRGGLVWAQHGDICELRDKLLDLIVAYEYCDGDTDEETVRLRLIRDAVAK